MSLHGPKDMPSIVQHRLQLLPHVRPVKQKLRRLHSQWSLKDNKVRVCVNFRDLNKDNAKNDFPLSHIHMLVNNTVSHSLLSFMDGFSGYNQILMALEDMEKTVFIIEWACIVIGLALPSRLMRWLVLMTEFDIQYVTQKSIKGSVFAGHLASLLVSDSGVIDDDFLDEGIVIVTRLPESRIVPAYCYLIDDVEIHDDFTWYYDIYQFLIFDTYPKVATTKDKRAFETIDH
ncbi:hypothetical protein CK203_110549 [Vitis vinifera]|uniref:Transposon Ty3-I Gag-Pol polyprotein n=1 Tax=Vitis vinifera TaxID=29760 RepID=A0A438CCE0_VITVI|nr:hypothetical protein CK203_110549 [Vitis vinifera]